MDNQKRERSEFVYNLSQSQMEALTELAFTRDRPVLELLMEAIDEFIEQEKNECQKTP
jgi:hypothetical protein